MRLVQKSLLHTGYFILKNGDIYPAFTADLIAEVNLQPFKKEVFRVYGVRSDLYPLICEQIKEFKKEHGVAPQNLVAIIRTGFTDLNNLKQSHHIYKYK